MAKKGAKHVKKRKKPAQKKSVGKTIRRGKTNPKTGAKPRSVKKTKDSTRTNDRKPKPRVYKTGRRRSSEEVSTKGLRYATQYDTSPRAARAFYIRKKVKKFSGKLPDKKTTGKELIREAEDFVGKSRTHFYGRFRIWDPRTGLERWISSGRQKIENGETTYFALDDLFDLLETGQYGKNVEITGYDFEVNLKKDEHDLPVPPLPEPKTKNKKRKKKR